MSMRKRPADKILKRRRTDRAGDGHENTENFHEHGEVEGLVSEQILRGPDKEKAEEANKDAVDN